VIFIPSHAKEPHMSDPIADRAEALALPWFSRSMRILTGLVAVGLFVPLVIDLPGGDPVPVAGVLVAGALVSLAGAAALTTGLKVFSLVIRVPLSLYLYPG
jgi:hypothetical protein